MRKRSILGLGPVYWCSLAVVFAVGFFADKREGDWNIVLRLERTPKIAAVAASMKSRGVLTIQAAENGMFYTDGMARDTPLRFLVDTGATYLTLQYEDAVAMGLSLADTHTICYATANGRACGGRTIIKVLGVGDITMENVEVIIASSGTLKGNLLGMSFLSRLKRFEFTRDGRRLVLEQ